MARMFWSANTSEIALSAATAKTVLQIISATNRRTVINKWGVFFDGVSPTAEPVQVRVLRQTTAIGGSPTTITPVKTKPFSDTLQVTAAASAGGSEPTASDVLWAGEVHPQSGYCEILPEEVGDWEMDGGTRIGIECTAPATVNVRALACGEE